MGESEPLLIKLEVMALAVTAGYLFSCVVAMIGLSLLIISENAVSGSYDGDFTFHAFGTFFAGFVFVIPLILVASPAFFLLRLGLWALRRKDWPSFAVAGAICALAFLLLMSDARLSDEHFWELVWRYPPDLWVCLVGAIAGAAECLTERRVIGWVNSRLVAQTNPEPGL